MAFQLSFTIFLAMAALAFIVVIKTKGILSLPLVLGIFTFVLSFTGLISKDLIMNSKMNYVGIMAYQVLIIHSGTAINMSLVKKYFREIIYFILSITLIVILLMLLSKKGSLFRYYPLIIGPMIGGGATTAITSFMSKRAMPGMSLLPWLVFMINNIVALPFVIYLLKKGQVVSHKIKATETINQIEEPLKNPIAEKYKTPAYYLALLMGISFINQFVHGKLLTGFFLPQVVFALFIGILLGHFRWIKRNPLHYSDALGFLMLGLISLMVNEILMTPASTLISLMKPLLIIIGIILLLLGGINYILSKLFKMNSTKAGLILLAPMLSQQIVRPLLLNSKAVDQDLIDLLSFINLFSISFFSIILTSILN